MELACSQTDNEGNILNILNDESVDIKSNETYSTGAIRSPDAMKTDYWLITPIGLKRLVAAYKNYKHRSNDLHIRH